MTMLDAPSTTPGDRAALDGAATTNESNAGRIIMRGRDAAALLHRLSTNDITKLQPGAGTRTVLATAIGRIIDVLAAYRLDDGLLLATSADQGPRVWALLKKNIFFNDQVTLEAAGRTFDQLALFGPHAAATIRELSGMDADALRMHQHAETTLAGATVRVARREPIGGAGFTLFVPLAQADAVRAALHAAGALPLDPATFDMLRVEQGYGAWGRELSEAYIPLETGLLDAISFTKGCYVGQEIIARMESRNRLAKQLRGLRLSEPIAAPGKLQVDGKEAGDLTSAVVSPRFGPIALAYVRSAHAAPGSRVGIAGSTVTGDVVELPFS